MVEHIFFCHLKYTDPAKVVGLVSEHQVAAQQSVSLDCQAEGNPQPTYSWTPCDPQQSVCHESVLDFQASDKSVYTFTCKVENYLGSDTRNTTVCKLARAKLCLHIVLLYFVMIINFQKSVEHTSGCCNLLIKIVRAIIFITVTSF